MCRTAAALTVLLLAPMRAILFLLLVSTVLLPPREARADTDYLRELAKNRVRVLIVASGSEAFPLARALHEAIRGNPDFRRRNRPDDAQLLLPAEAEQALKVIPDRRKVSIVLLLTGKDLAEGATALSPSLMGLLPFETDVLKGRESVQRSLLDVGRPGEAAFRVAMYAPDAVRLRRLYDEWLGRRTGGFRDLPFSRRYVTNRVAVFGPAEMAPMLEKWGHFSTERGVDGVWNETRYLPLEERPKLSADALAEYSEVYLWDRSRVSVEQARALLPSHALQLIENRLLGPTTVVVARDKKEEIGGQRRPWADRTVLVSAPSPLLLTTRFRRRPTVASLMEEPVAAEVLDLSGLGTCSLLVVGGGSQVTPEIAGSLHAQIARSMRGDFHLAVEPRSALQVQLEGELALQMAQGATGTRGLMQRKSPTRYMWVFHITSVNGGTGYTPSDRKLTPDLPAFTQSEPVKPTRNKDEDDEDLARRIKTWREKRERWQEARREWWDRNRNEPCEWEQTIRWDSRVEVRGLLQLIDTKTAEGPRVLWEREGHSTTSDTGLHLSRRVNVQGHEARPETLETPTAHDRFAPALLLNAAVTAGRYATNPLLEEALLPQRLAATPQAQTAVTPPVVVRPASSPLDRAEEKENGPRAKIAEIDGKTVVLNIGARHGVRVGDRFEVLLKYKETVDPDTKKVIRLRVQESLTVTVTMVDEEASDCVPTTPQDAAKLSQARIGGLVRRLPVSP